MPRRSNPLPVDDEVRLRSLLRILEQLDDHGLSIGMASAFIMVAMDEGCSLRDVVERSGRPQSTVSRHLLDLGERNRSGAPGPNVVAWRISPDELRRKEYSLTPRGRSLLRRVTEELTERKA